MLVGTVMPTLGPLPPQWRDRFENEKLGHRENGQLENHGVIEWWWDKGAQKETLRGTLERYAYKGFSPGQLEHLWGILEGMLVYEPGARISAAEVARRLERAP